MEKRLRTPSPRLPPLVAKVNRPAPSGSTFFAAPKCSNADTVHWARATECDIRKSLGGDLSVSVGEFVGRGDYYIAHSEGVGTLFIKALLFNQEDDNILRRISGERLAGELSLPSDGLFSPLISKNIVESCCYPGDYYVVSDFEENSDALSSSDPSISDVIVNKLGRFIYSLERISIPPRFAERKAADAVEMLYFLSRLDEAETLSSLARGGNEVLAIIRSEADLISELCSEVRGKSVRSGFSHGDLKLSQLLQKKDGSILVCDWEECGVAPAMNDLSFAAADIFYSQIRRIVDDYLDHAEDQFSLQDIYDNAVGLAIDKIHHLVNGYVNASGEALSQDEKRVFEIRLGLAGLFRLYTVSAKTNAPRPRELALASIGMQVAAGQGIDILGVDRA
ncbi:hypothetical protein FRC0421_00743 [Corynebacterium diphtheriae]|nr:hypothetical protein FRC0209_00787 [Corynebacterium diphtheriae]CAB0829066.1 hypothetical protein FRC0323_00006 [Corynebacterium diphtheriae]CAB0897684.1 hypothetical protein FRC0421_00743 [Corynebacterium diphtheriae]